MTEQLPQDHEARIAALAVSRSFIVQAPAGSGKTAILIQRILNLLKDVEQPEEILAITFTRKAADEMRVRLLEALRAAQSPAPEGANDRLTWKLATAALAQDSKLDWQILDNPGRLRIQTIDSLCASLVRQMPLAARIGAPLAIADNPEFLYQQAARTTLTTLNADIDVSRHIYHLLQHLDNNLGKVESLIASMLARRDQWLGVTTADNPRELLESGFQEVISDHLQKLWTEIPDEAVGELAFYLAYAAGNLHSTQYDKGQLNIWLDQSDLALAQSGELAAWQGIASLLLTNDGNRRKTVTVREGFPVPKGDDQAKTIKTDFLELLNQLPGQSDWLSELHFVRNLPSQTFEDQQWALLQSLQQILIHATAELQLVFQDLGAVDYAEIQLRALQALGDLDDPSDLALRLDQRIQHILVDEFQDTSYAQFTLLKQLCAGWTENDGRTLFVVGDPMQSIYRFRNAEIGLYLQALHTGVGSVALEPLKLTVNFRSQQGIVEWVNDTFSQVFPANTDVNSGTVGYEHSDPWHPPGCSPPVHLHPRIGRDDQGESAQILPIIREALEQDHRVAVLVRSRDHLRQISQQLKQQKISFQALDILPLSTMPVIQDLRSLTRAMLHQGDRLAWLSVLRAPWCGLDNADLLAVGEQRADLPLVLNDTARWQAISDTGQTALRRLTDIIADARGDQGRLPLRQWIEGIWLSLGGAAILELPIEEDAAESYFELLEEHEHAGDIVDFAAFDQALERLFAPPDPAASDQVQLMTIHKSKGLQFDTVILPGLGKSARNEDKRLLEWQLRPNRHGNTDLLTAPIHGTGDPDDDSYRYLRSIEKQKTDQEVCRLLYVATTRARQALHLFGHVTWNDKKETCNPPASGSLLASLWPAVKSQFEQLSPDELQQQEQAPVCINTIKRLPVDWQLSELPVQLIKTDTPPVTSSETTIEFDWAGETARHTGTLIHRYLERMAHEGPSHWSAQRLINQQDAMRTALTNLGVAEEELNTAVDKTRSGLINALADPRGQWILTNHSQASSELALTAITPEGPKTYVIDRTFVDNEGKRWIIDYKTGGHQGGQLEQFLDQEQQRYREQLESYGELFASQSEHPVMLALYFPVTGGWREWPLPTESVE